MVDCMNLVESELGWSKAGRAIMFIDENYDNAWSKHLNELMDLVCSQKYDHDEDFRMDTAGWHYDFISKHIKIYKAESPEFSKVVEDLFANLGTKQTEEA